MYRMWSITSYHATGLLFYLTCITLDPICFFCFLYTVQTHSRSSCMANGMCYTVSYYPNPFLYGLALCFVLIACQITHTAHKEQGLAPNWDAFHDTFLRAPHTSLFVWQSQCPLAAACE